MSVLLVIGLNQRTTIGSSDSPRNYVIGLYPKIGPLFLLVPSFLPRTRTFVA